MIYNAPLISLLYVCTGILVITMAAVIWNRRPAPGAATLAVFLIVSVFWILGGALESAANNPVIQSIYAKASYTAILLSGVAWLCFVLDYSSSGWWRRPRNLLLISLIPIIIMIITWTYPFPGPIWDEIGLGINTFSDIFKWPRIAYSVSSLYQYFLYLYGAWLLIKLYRRKTGINRKQISLVIIGTLIAVLGTVVEIIWTVPVKVDIGPFYVLAGALLYCYGFVHYRFLDILPVAHKTLIRQIPDGILVLDPEGIILEMNPAAARLFRNDPYSAPNQSLEAVWPELNRIITAKSHDLHYEITTGAADAPVHLDVRAVNLRNNRQEKSGRLILLRDISELKKAQQTAENHFKKEHEARNILEDEINKRTQYSRAIVHELRTPLTSIIACTELLEDQAKEKTQASLVQVIRRSSLNLEQRVNELFELARGENGLIKIEPVEMDMKSLINEVVTELRPISNQKGIALRAEISEPSLILMGDRGRLHQVLANLIGNSLKFTSSGEIVIHTKIEPAYLQVEVSDTGRGIDPRQMEFLFDPYRRQNPEEQSTSGLGIGLALCKIFIELHKGKIWVESTPGQGTTFSFTLPINQHLHNH